MVANNNLCCLSYSSKAIVYVKPLLHLSILAIVSISSKKLTAVNNKAVVATIQKRRALASQ